MLCLNSANLMTFVYDSYYFSCCHQLSLPAKD